MLTCVFLPHSHKNQNRRPLPRKQCCRVARQVVASAKFKVAYLAECCPNHRIIKDMWTVDAFKNSELGLERGLSI